MKAWRASNRKPSDCAERQRKSRELKHCALPTPPTVLSNNVTAKQRKRRRVEIVNDGSVVELPASYLKRASEFHKCLGHSKNPVMRAAVSAHSFFKVLKSPTTSQVAVSVLNSHPTLSKVVRDLFAKDASRDDSLRKKLNRDIKAVIRWRKQGWYNKCQGVKEKWKCDKLSLRRVSNVTSTPLSTLRWYFSKPKGNPRKLTCGQRTNVLQFFYRSDVTMQLPHKRYAKFHFLRTPFEEQYKRYVKNELFHRRIPVSRTSVHRILPKTMKKCGKIPFQNCKCNTCENCSLIVAAGLAWGVLGLSSDLTENATLSMCPNPKIDDYKRPIYSCGINCRRRECKDCKNRYSSFLNMRNRTVDLSGYAKWHWWGHKYTIDPNTGKSVKSPYQENWTIGTRADLIGALKLNMLKLPQHLFHYHWQAEMMEELKTKLEPGEVLVIVDFAKNITFPRQNEVQHGFFHRQSATLHPVVMYYRCKNHKDCNHIVHDEFMCISRDLSHDAHAVHTYTKRALQHLRDQGTPVEKLYIFSDNCSNQYKSKLPFELLQHYGIPAEHHYFGAGHGKSAADGFVGRIKRLIEQNVRAGRAYIQDALDLAVWCQSNATSQTRITKDSDMCQHYQRHFEYFHTIDRTYVGTAKTVKGTMQLHSVKTTDIPGQLLCRDTSCFCRSISCISLNYTSQHHLAMNRVSHFVFLLQLLQVHGGGDLRTFRASSRAGHPQAREGHEGEQIPTAQGKAGC